MKYWGYRVSSHDTGIESVDIDEAQHCCNFVVLQPKESPHWTVEQVQLRKEAPPCGANRGEHRPSWTSANTASVILRLRRDDGPSVRLKQFLYEWGSPGIDEPAMWGKERAPFDIEGKTAGWHGTDYKDRKAVSANLWGTQCEGALTEGTIESDAFENLYRQLRPVCAHAADKITATRQDVLSYWVRYRIDRAENFPLGLWKYRPVTDGETFVFPVENDTGPLEGISDYETYHGGFRYGDNSRIHELEYIYGDANKHRTLSVRNIDADLWQEVNAWPPELDDRPCEVEHINLSNRTGWLASFNPDIGPHEVVWRDSDQQIWVCQLSAHPDSTLKKAVSYFEDVHLQTILKSREFLTSRASVVSLSTGVNG